MFHKLLGAAWRRNGILIMFDWDVGDEVGANWCRLEVGDGFASKVLRSGVGDVVLSAIGIVLPEKMWEEEVGIGKEL